MPTRECDASGQRKIVAYGLGSAAARKATRGAEVGSQNRERSVMTDLAAPDELQDYVAGVTPDDLAGAVLTGVADQGTKQLLEAEKPVVRAWRKRTGRPGTDVPSTGLALSGGGIRSAAFSLGVIQALVARELLRRMDYV